MAYRLNGTDPFLRASVGAFNGYNVRGAAASGFALLKRNATTAWHGIYCMDQGSSSVAHDWLEFDPTDHLGGYLGTGAGYSSAATFADTTNWMIVGFTWDGTTGGWTWWWKIGAGAWQSEVETLSGVFTLNAGAGYRHIIGNEAALGDDANFDIVCAGAIKSKLTSTQVQSLTQTDIASWDAVFTGSTAWLLGFDAIGTRSDRTGNGGNELSRSAGVTLVADPSGWSWGGTSSTLPQGVGVGVGVAPSLRVAASQGVGIGTGPAPSSAAGATRGVGVGAGPTPTSAASSTPVPGIGVGAGAAPTARATLLPGIATGAGAAPAAAAAATIGTATGVGALPSAAAAATSGTAIGAGTGPATRAALIQGTGLGVGRPVTDNQGGGTTDQIPQGLGTGTGAPVTGRSTTPSGVGTGAGAAPAGRITITVGAATGTASPPTSTTSVTPVPGLASGQGLPPTARITVAAGVAAGVGLAPSLRVAAATGFGHGVGYGPSFTGEQAPGRVEPDGTVSGLRDGAGAVTNSDAAGHVVGLID